MKKSILLTIILVATFVQCKDNYPDEIFGTYEATTDAGFSRFKIYAGNFYSVKSTNSKDTGVFTLDKDTFYLKSTVAQSDREKDLLYSKRDHHKLFYNKGKLFYVTPANPIDKTTSLDTINYWTKK